jgi:hypothetical protein
MDADPGSSLRPGGTLEPANRAAVAKERFQTPNEPATARFEVRDPFAEVTYRANTFENVAAKADQLGSKKVHAIDAEGKRTLIEKVNGAWPRSDAPKLPLPVRAPVQDPVHVMKVAPQAPTIPPEAAIARIDAEAERTARIARIEAALAERYVIKRAAASVGDIALGQTEYRYRGDAARVAFTASTFRLVTNNNNPSVARSMIDLAEARNWQGLRVSGNEDFKRLVWLEASVRGVKAVGYEPQPGDQELLRRERESRSVNRIEHVTSTPPPGAQPPAKESARGSGGRKTVLAALEAVLIAKRVPQRQREAVMAAAAVNLAQRLRDGQTLKVKVYDKAAPTKRAPEPAKPEPQRTREQVIHAR